MSDSPPIGELPAFGAPVIFRGVRRALWERGFASIAEFPLPCSRRADVFGFDDAGTTVIVEVKSGVPDFRADQKWPEYRDWCDLFYFAVDDAFPTDLIPGECGLFVADAFGAASLRESPMVKIPAARRNGLIRRAALLSARRLHRLEDPLFSLSTAAS
jgi:hypothetical protein